MEWQFSEEMIELPFLERLQIMMFLRYSFVITSSVFCFLFFLQGESKIGVRIIHRNKCAHQILIIKLLLTSTFTKCVSLRYESNNVWTWFKRRSLVMWLISGLTHAASLSLWDKDPLVSWCFRARREIFEKNLGCSISQQRKMLFWSSGHSNECKINYFIIETAIIDIDEDDIWISCIRTVDQNKCAALL